jgi:hypothetical protein
MSAEADPSAKLDLYELARLNGDSTRERYERLRDGSPGAADAVERFCQRVEREGRVSINTRSARLLRMLRNGYYPNPHDEARERAQQEGGDSEDYLKRQQGQYYRKRVTFERSFVDGENFRYASLNIAGTGLSYYGPYCLVLRDPEDGDLAALLPANSLKRFVNDEPQLDAAALRREVAPWPNRHHLAACKHAHDVANTPDADWPKMMCHATETDESFVEIILGSPVTPQALIELRVDKAKTHLDDLVAGTVTGTLTDSERTELMTRLEVVEELQKHQLDTLYREV